MKIKRILLLFFISVITLFAADKYYVDIQNINNGSYLGQYTVSGYDYNTVVEVYSRSIINIKLLNPPNNNVLMKADKSFNAMIEMNNIEADSVTGATWKALVYNALSKKTPYIANQE